MLWGILLPVFLSAQRTAQRIDGARGQKIGFYQYLPPDYQSNPDVKHPLIIFLHGIGEKGTGLEPDLARLNCCGIPKYIDKGHNMIFTWNGKTEGFVVLFPQLDSKYTAWPNYYVDEMINFAKKNLNIDTNRIFLTGLSLGGGGTWTYVSSSLSNAKKLAGAAPVVSPCFMTNGCNIANAQLPILAFHALDDVMAPPSCTFTAIKSINDCGAKASPNMVVYEVGGHYVWVRRAYDTAYNYQNPNIFEWMLAQNRSLKPNQKPLAKAGKDIVLSASQGTVVLDGSASSDPDGKIARHIWRKIGGPSYGTMLDGVTAHPRLTGLNYPGVYAYELKAVDDRAEWSVDTVTVTVVPGTLPLTRK